MAAYVHFAPKSTGSKTGLISKTGSWEGGKIGRNDFAVSPDPRSRLHIALGEATSLRNQPRLGNRLPKYYETTISESYQQLVKSTRKVLSCKLLVDGDALLLLLATFLNFAIVHFANFWYINSR